MHTLFVPPFVPADTFTQHFYLLDIPRQPTCSMKLGTGGFFISPYNPTYMCKQGSYQPRDIQQICCSTQTGLVIYMLHGTSVTVTDECNGTNTRHLATNTSKLDGKPLPHGDATLHQSSKKTAVHIIYTCTQVVICYILYNCICIIIYTQYTTCDASALCLLCKCHAYHFLMN